MPMISKRSTVTTATGIEMEKGEDRMRLIRWEEGEKGESGMVAH
jgi:hypothetical protein